MTVLSVFSFPCKLGKRVSEPELFPTCGRKSCRKATRPASWSLAGGSNWMKQCPTMLIHFVYCFVYHWIIRLYCYVSWMSRVQSWASKFSGIFRFSNQHQLHPISMKRIEKGQPKHIETPKPDSVQHRLVVSGLFANFPSSLKAALRSWGSTSWSCGGRLLPLRPSQENHKERERETPANLTPKTCKNVLFLSKTWSRTNKKRRNTELLLPHIYIGSSNWQTNQHIQLSSNYHPTTSQLLPVVQPMQHQLWEPRYLQDHLTKYKVESTYSLVRFTKWIVLKRSQDIYKTTRNCTILCLLCLSGIASTLKWMSSWCFLTNKILLSSLCMRLASSYVASSCLWVCGSLLFHLHTNNRYSRTRDINDTSTITSTSTTLYAFRTKIGIAVRSSTVHFSTSELWAVCPFYSDRTQPNTDL